MACTGTSPTLTLGQTVLRPGAAARTPFGTRFFRLALDPDPDTGTGTGTFAKRPLGRRMDEEIAAWGKLQRTGKLRENRVSAGVLQRNRFAGNDDGAMDSCSTNTERAVGGSGGFGGVAGAGYPSYFVPSVDGPRDGTGIGDSEAMAASTGGGHDHNHNDDCLWPDTYSNASDSDIDHILDGFVVIDMTDATGSVFWNQPRRRRRKHPASPGRSGRKGGLSLWSRILGRLRPGKKAH